MHQSITSNVLLALSCFFTLALSTNYYVATTGSDTNAGTSSAPFLTLAKAQLAVRAELPTQALDIYIYVANGTYQLAAPLNLTAIDSGQNGYKVIWMAQGSSVNLSGGSVKIHSLSRSLVTDASPITCSTQLTHWTVYNSTSGVYRASAPANSKSRHLYANNIHAQRARSTLTRSWLNATSTGYTIADSAASYLLTLPGIEHGEIRAINSFTDRYIPVDSVSNGSIIMKQPAWQNNIIGYDTVTAPAADEGFFIENVLSLLDSPNEFYLNSTTATVYYKPPSGVNIASMSIVLPRLEQLVVFSGTLGRIAI